MYNIMIVEDDIKISTLIYDNLKKWNYKAFYITEFDNILKIFMESQPDLILLDINLPYFDGYYWCKEIRNYSRVPIIFISARDNNMDIVMAMNMGGDDYIRKPFSIDVLMAKINALIRRTYSYKESAINIISYKDIVLNIKNRTLKYNTKSLVLSYNEFNILYFFMNNPNTIISRYEIIKELWDSDQFIDDNTLTVNVNRLRKKLSSIGINDLIITHKKKGYILK